MTAAAGPAAPLASSSSPFLRRHSGDGVRWSAWGEQRPGERPVFLSIGFAACHLCEVMRRESFNDPEICRLLAERFASVLVDREEHPEVDALYLEALHALTGRAGYPANLFLLPSGEPFYGAAYLPPTDFLRLLQAVVAFFDDRPGDARAQGEAVRARLEYLPAATGSDPDPERTVTDARLTLLAEHDDEHGGFGRAPKFPAPGALDFLLQHAVRTRHAASLRVVEKSLDGMAHAALHDLVGGGFHRYTVDREWQVPHFEKVLADNVVLASTYLRASQTMARSDYAVVAERTLDFVLRDLLFADDLVATALDASAGGLPGSSYLWTWRDLCQALGERDAAVAGELYGVEGKSAEPQLLRVAAPEGVFGGLEDDLRRRLLEARRARPQPERIETVVVSDVGLAVGALAVAAAPLRRPDYLATANRLADRALSGFPRLTHLLAGGALDLPGLLHDYAGMVDGLLALYQASGDQQRAEQALELAKAALDLFADPDRGGFVLAPESHEALVAPTKPLADRPAPSGNSLLALALLRLADLTHDEVLERAALRALELAPLALLSVPSPALVGHMLFAVEIRLAPPAVLALVGDPRDPAMRRLTRIAREHADPTLTIAYGDAASTKALPVLAADGTAAGAPAAVLCDRSACMPPEHDANRLRATLRARAECRP